MSENILFWRIFSKRVAITLFITLLLFLSCILKLAVTAVSDYSEIRQKQSTLKLKIKDLRGCEAHSTYIIEQSELNVIKNLGINLTCEPKM